MNKPIVYVIVLVLIVSAGMGLFIAMAQAPLSSTSQVFPTRAPATATPSSTRAPATATPSSGATATAPPSPSATAASPSPAPSATINVAIVQAPPISVIETATAAAQPTSAPTQAPPTQPPATPPTTGPATSNPLLPPPATGSGRAPSPVTRPGPRPTSPPATPTPLPTATSTPAPPTATPTPTWDYVVVSIARTPLSGAPSTATIRGRLLDRNGKPVPFAQFAIRSDSFPAWTSSATADANGNVYFSVSKGRFAVDVVGGRSQDAGWMETGQTGVDQMYDYTFVFQATS